jgi:Ca2+-binding RTX toxin-like protein
MSPTHLAAALAGGVLSLLLPATAGAARGFQPPTLDGGVLSVRGTAAADAIALHLSADQPGTLQVDVGGGAIVYSFPRADVASIVIDARGGDDTVRLDQTGGAPVSLSGGAGDDTLIGGPEADMLSGGADDDTLVWAPGGGSDVLDGGRGADTLRMSGSAIAERLDLSASGKRLRLTRDIASVTLDAAGIEDVSLAPLGGADTITVGNLARTGVTRLDADLSGFGGVDDGSLDRVAVAGTSGPDAIQATGAGGSVTLSGLDPVVSVANSGAGDRLDLDLAADGRADTVTVSGGEGADAFGLTGDGQGGAAVAQGSTLLDVQHADAGDQLRVQGLGGPDQLNAAALPALPLALVLDGGDGDDVVLGGQGADTLIGGDGADLVDGNLGQDVAFLGTGDDVFQWDPGDSSDLVEGQDGADRIQFNASNASEDVELSANGSRLRLTRSIAAVLLDAAGVERVDVRLLGGADTLKVDDLAGTDVTSVNGDLAAFDGTGDGSADRVVVEGTEGDDALSLGGDAGGIAINGGAVAVGATGAEPGTDLVQVDALGGADAVEGSGLVGVGLVAFGGEGDDVLIGGTGADSLFGEGGDDVLLGGPGVDLLDGGTGDNIVIQD